MDLQNIRKSSGLTQAEVANAIGISRAAYTNIETGERRPSVDTAKKIAVLLKFNWTEFFPDDDKAV